MNLHTSGCAEGKMGRESGTERETVWGKLEDVWEER